MSAWDGLARELARWAEAGRSPGFWWRDDDAAVDTPALRRLCDLRGALDVPLAIAAIPAAADGTLAALLRPQDAIAALQHGWAHANHAPPGAPKAELGAGRAAWDIARELAQGRGRLIALMEGALLPVLVPPWNRIDPALPPLLPGLGYDGLSVFGARPAAEAAPALRAVNVHIDIVDWPGTRRFVGDDAAIGQAVAHLAARRDGAADAGEPTGLMTHHLAHDEACWDFIPRFVAAVRAGGGRWLHARALFAVE